MKCPNRSVLFSHNLSHSEVAKVNCSIRLYHNVLWLYVAMFDFFLVEVLQTFGDLQHDPSNIT